MSEDNDDDFGSAPLMDFGSGVTGRFYGWAPDRAIESNRVLYEGVPDVEKMGMSFNHPRVDDPAKRCGGFVTFRVPGVTEKVFPDHATWEVESWEPMTLSPSLLCRTCGRHGFIRQGRWVEA